MVYSGQITDMAVHNVRLAFNNFPAFSSWEDERNGDLPSSVWISIPVPNYRGPGLLVPDLASLDPVKKTGFEGPGLRPLVLFFR